MNTDAITRLEVLKLAFQIEESTTQGKIFYIDVGNLPKAKAEEYVKDIMQKYTTTGKPPAANPEYFIPRREGNRGTELAVLPGRATIENVLKTAAKLNDYVETGTIQA